MDGPDDGCQFVLDNMLAELFVREAELFEIIIIEEMAKGTVSHVMKKRGDPKELFYVIGRRTVRRRGLERRVEVASEPACQVHGAERVLEPAVLGRGVDPPGALELIYLPQALHPGSVNDVLLGLFSPASRRGEGNVAVDRVSQEGRAFVELFSPRQLAHGKHYTVKYIGVNLKKRYFRDVVTYVALWPPLHSSLSPALCLTWPRREADLFHAASGDLCACLTYR